MVNTVLLSKAQIYIIIERLSRQIIECFDLSNLVIIGVQPRGSLLANLITQKIETITKQKMVFGKIDITFYRDDFRRGKHLKADNTEINFEIENKQVLLIDDVLFTGRTIRAALDALMDFGRPKQIELLVLIDRRFNRELPISPDFFGITVDTIEENLSVNVQWNEAENSCEQVIFIKENK